MKISVAMTTYNGERFIGEQVDSILGQSRLPDEIVICDDRSDDATVAILRGYAERSPIPVRVMANNERLGSTKNFERAVSLCSGDLIVLSDQDDLWCPNKLALFEQFFMSDCGISAVITDAKLIDEQGRDLPDSLWTRFKINETRQAILNSHKPHDLLLGFPVATGATMAFRATLKSIILPFPTNCPTFIHDRWIAVVAAAVGRLSAIPERLLSYRIHSQQQLGVGKLPLIKTIWIPHEVRSDAAALDALEERLKSSPGWAASNEFWEALERRKRHVAERRQLSRNPLMRLLQVCREYRSDGYLLYPYGWFAAGKDLMVGTR